MENFSYHAPVYVVTGGIDTSGHSSELAAGQVGLFDRATFSVATAAGNGTEFFFAQGNTGGKSWYGQPVTESHKSPFFLGKDVENIYKSLPQTIQNEEWVIGYNGAASSVSLKFEKGKATRVRLYFHGQPTYRFYSGPKEYVVSYTPEVDCTEPCAAGDCPEGITDCLVHTKALVDKINNHTELRKFGVTAKLVVDPFSATSANMEKYSLQLCDNGDVLALNAVKAQYPTKKITRISRVGSTSTYEFCQPVADAAPANFTQSGSVLLAVCGECPGGTTLTAEKDVYIIRRPLAGNEDLTSDAAKDTYADTVGTAYSVATDADKVFIGQDGAVAILKIKFAAGATVTALLADTVEFSHTEAATCTYADATPVAWTLSGTGISSTRTLKIKALQRPDCDSDGDRISDLEAILAGVEGIDLNSITKIAGTACADDYTVEQASLDCYSEEECQTNNVTFHYDSLPAFENKAWEVVPETVVENSSRKCGIRITAGYQDIQYGNCSFQPTDYYENMPVKMEVSLLQEDGDNCDAAAWPSVQQTRFGRIARQSGHWVVREVLMKTAAYLQHVSQFSLDSREREAFDMNLLNSVDRFAFYDLYYVTLKASYGKSFRKNEQEKFTAVFAFKVGDPAAKLFESGVLDVLTLKSGVKLHVNS